MKRVIVGLIAGIAAAVISTQANGSFQWKDVLFLGVVLFAAIILLWNQIIAHKITAAIAIAPAVYVSSCVGEGLKDNLMLIPIGWVMVFIFMRGLIFGFKLEFGYGKTASGAPRRQSFRRRFISSVENTTSSAVTNFIMGTPETHDRQTSAQYEYQQKLAQDRLDRYNAKNEYLRHSYNAEKYAGTQDGYEYQNMANDAFDRM